MKRKILLVALGATLFVGCTNTSARAPTDTWNPDPTQTFTPFSHYKKIDQVYVDYGATPEPTRPKVKQPSPTVTVITKRSVPVYKAPRRHVIPRVVSAPTSPKAYALARVGSVQFSCLNSLWNKESHWNYRAYNRSSGAYGIPQALPGSKMSAFGSDWRTNPITQVKWGLNYINGRYGSACGAWNHSKRYNWY